MQIRSENRQQIPFDKVTERYQNENKTKQKTTFFGGPTKFTYF